MSLEVINWVIIFIALALIIATAIIKKDKNLVTVIGILGTFIGIILWLLAFDTNNIAESISWLLNGLKTAFITSIFWLATSLFLWLKEKKEVWKDDSDFLIEIRDELKKLNSWEGEKNNEINILILDELKNLNSSISWNNEWNLLSQNKILKESFDNFAKEISENNSKALIKAITEVMNDFNSNINDQLGQNFKDLSGAIEKLIIWQDQYKENIINSTNTLKISQKSLEKSGDLFEMAAKNSQNFSSISQKLWNELVTLNDSLKIFQQWNNEFKGISSSFSDMSEKMILWIDSLSKNFTSKANIMVWESEKQITFMVNTFATQSWDLKEAHSTILNRMKKDIEYYNKEMSEQFLRIWARLEQQVQTLDEQLWKELEKSLNWLGQQLTSLSWKFVSDYAELAKKLEKLVK